jgi:hypothetical protein
VLMHVFIPMEDISGICCDMSISHFRDVGALYPSTFIPCNLLQKHFRTYVNWTSLTSWRSPIIPDRNLETFCIILTVLKVAAQLRLYRSVRASCHTQSTRFIKTHLETKYKNAGISIL